MRQREFIETSKLREALEKGYDLKFTIRDLDVIVQSKHNAVGNYSDYYKQPNTGNPVYICTKAEGGDEHKPLRKETYVHQWCLDAASDEYQAWIFKHANMPETFIWDWRYLCGLTTKGATSDNLNAVWEYYDHAIKANMLYPYITWQENGNKFIFENPMKLVNEDTVILGCGTKKPTKRRRPIRHKKSAWKSHPKQDLPSRSAIAKVQIANEVTSKMRRIARLAEKAKRVSPEPLPPSSRYSIVSPFRIIRRGSKPRGQKKEPYQYLQLIDTTPHTTKVVPTRSKKHSRLVRTNLLEEETVTLHRLVPIFEYVPRLFKSKKHPEWNETEPTEHTHYIPVLQSVIREPYKIVRLTKPTYKTITVTRFPSYVIEALKATSTPKVTSVNNGSVIIRTPRKLEYLELDSGIQIRGYATLYKKDNFFRNIKTTTD